MHIRAFRKRSLSLLLSISLGLSFCTAAVYADPGAQTEAGLEQEQALTPDNLAENSGDLSGGSTDGNIDINEENISDPTDPSDVESSDDSSQSDLSAGDSSNDGSPEEEEDKEKEEELESEEETEEEEADEAGPEGFEETGIFNIRITDRNGAEVVPWHDEASDIYYLFLTNASSISDLELKVEGVLMDKTSRGTLDKKTNIVKGAFQASGDGITLTDKNGLKYNVVVRQSGIPSLTIKLNGTTLDTINSGRKTSKYPGQSVILTDASGNVSLSQTDVELKGRGNTTWDQSDKKPYQIKFAKKESVLGMAPAKKWVLLANAFDDSLLRNKVAFYLGDALGMRYTPDQEFTELWIDGEYLGVYTIGEKCEIGSGRLDLTDPLGALAEFDNAYYLQNDYWFHDSNFEGYFGLADQVKDSQAEAAMNNFQAKTSAFGNYLFGTDPSKITVKNLNKYIDVESFAKWYLASEYLTNIDAGISSWYWYCDGPSDVLHLGPMWDFDTSSGSPEMYSSSTLMFINSYSPMVQRMMSCPAVASYVKEMYAQYRGVFSGLPGKVSQWGSQISPAAEGNYIRWPWLGTTQQKGKTFSSSYAGSVSYLSSWLSRRDSGFGIDVPAAVTARTDISVSQNGKTMTLEADNVTGTGTVSAAVWSANKGQDDLKWYTLTRSSNGTYTATVDLTRHGSTDTYYAHFYSGSTLLGAHDTKVTNEYGKAGGEGRVPGSKGQYPHHCKECGGLHQPGSSSLDPGTGPGRSEMAYSKGER